MNNSISHQSERAIKTALSYPNTGWQGLVLRSDSLGRFSR